MYVDDTFLLFKDKSHVTPFLNYLNDQHINIKFTVDEEKDNKLPFLDVSIERVNNKFQTSVFRKNTFSGLGTSFFSYTPFLFKINAIKTLIFRGYQLSSNFTTLHQEFDFIRKFFVDNGFPSSLIYKCIINFISDKLSASLPPQIIFQRGTRICLHD